MKLAVSIPHIEEKINLLNIIIKTKGHIIDLRLKYKKTTVDNFFSFHRL